MREFSSHVAWRAGCGQSLSGCSVEINAATFSYIWATLFMFQKKGSLLTFNRFGNRIVTTARGVIMCFRRWAAVLLCLGINPVAMAADVQHKLSSSEETVAYEEYAVRTGNDVAVIYPFPEGVEKSSLYKLSVMGREVFCYADRRFDQGEGVPKDEFNMTTSPQAFAIFDFSGEVELNVEILDEDLLKKTQQFLVTPQSCGFRASLQDNMLTVRLNRPGNYVIDPDGTGRKTLHLFTALPEKTIPDRNDPNVVFFGPGVHDIREQIVLTSGQTLYLSGGAVLRPLLDQLTPGREQEMHYSGREYAYTEFPIYAEKAENIMIGGRGIISGGRGLPAGKRFGFIALHHCRDIQVRDVTMVQATGWTFYQWGCTNSTIDNVRILGWFTNSDGPCPLSCIDVTTKNCFIHTADDGLELKTDNFGNPSSGMHFEDCVLWCDAATAMGITHEISGSVSNVTYRNITILHYNYVTPPGDVPHRGAISILPLYGGSVRDLLFENITIESHQTHLPVIYIYNGKYFWDENAVEAEFLLNGKETPHSRVENVHFKNIKVLSYNDEYRPWIAVYDNSPSGDHFKSIVFEDTAYRDASGQLHPLELKTRGHPDVELVHRGESSACHHPREVDENRLDEK